MDNSVRKQKNGITLALIAKLMGLVIVLNTTSCSCDKGDPDKLGMQLTAGTTEQKIVVPSSSATGSVNTVLTVKLEKGAEELDLGKIKLIAEKIAAYESDNATGDADSGNKEHVALDCKGSDPSGRSLKDLAGQGELKKGEDVKVTINVALNNTSETASAKVKFHLEKDGEKIKSVEDVVVTYTTN